MHQESSFGTRETSGYRARPSHHNSAVDAQHLAGDIAGFRRREKCHCVGDVFGVPVLPSGIFDWMEFLISSERPAVMSVVMNPGRYRVDSDIAARQFAGKGLGKTDQACFTGRVICLPCIAHQADN